MAETFTTENTTEAKKTSISETKQHLRTNGGAQTPKSVHAADCLPTYKPTKLAVVWLIIGTIIVFWDIGYIFCRPHSFKAMKGKLSWMWPGYQLYETIDRVYSISAWFEGRGWPLAETTLNVVENFINMTYLYFALAGDADQKAIAPLVGFAGVLMTFSKTVLYFLSDYWCGWCETSHNSWSVWLGLYVLPNIFWVIFPGILTFRFAFEIAERLRYAAGLERGQVELGQARKVKST